ncbi:MAG: 1-deoxy-D-xylulose-5-phosphate synthase [Candidatus Hydrogenedentes bacterium]|nr:1-deoxy-D-xylulose-5-phosphate synthase [Candidatus Hydrogenedentota bacterium]
MASEQDCSLNPENLNTPILDGINSPRDLKSLSIDDLKALAQEIRDKIIATASVNGGHLAPHLGVVDLTIALHYVFDTESDMLVWDVGHQCYAHKLLTGRRDQLCTIRKKGGLSGYPKRSESPYDVFGVGHSSTSISAALGMAVARDLTQQEGRAIAVIGDGAITAGMAFEAMSNAGHLDKDLIVVLNDNNMSISKNVGAISAYFNKLITGGLYTRARGDMQTFMERMLPQQLTKAAERLEHSVKGFLMPGTIFEAFGLRYIGPVDGHDIETLVECFRNIKKGHGPVFFHVVTKKGKGYSYAEEDPLTYHGVQAFDIQTGQFQSSGASSAPTFTNVFADALIEAARKDPRVVAITAAMPTGTGLSKFEKEFPDRCFDVGICEQHAVTFGAGLATQGMRPVCAIYSTFLQRGYDQLIHDVCLQNLPVVFAIDRAGAVGEDSPTQQGAFDISFLRLVPNIKVGAPRDDADLRAMVKWALAEPGPSAIRYARSKAPAIGASEGRDILHGEVLREGADATLLAIGPVVGTCLAVAQALQQEGYAIAVADARWIKPLDTDLLDRLRHAPIITVEENTLPGGFGAAVIEHFADSGALDDLRIKRLGFPDRFLDHATREEQLAEIGLDAASIAESVRSYLGQPVAQPIS